MILRARILSSSSNSSRSTSILSGIGAVSGFSAAALDVLLAAVALSLLDASDRYFRFSLYSSGNICLNMGLESQLNRLDSLASFLLVDSDVVMLPVVASTPVMKESRPVRMVATDQLGFQDSSWKSDILRQSLLLTSKRPEGVDILIRGGLNGYSGGKVTLPWYWPFSYGVSGGPVNT